MWQLRALGPPRTPRGEAGTAEPSAAEVKAATSPPSGTAECEAIGRGCPFIVRSRGLPPSALLQDLSDAVPGSRVRSPSSTDATAAAAAPGRPLRCFDGKWLLMTGTGECLVSYECLGGPLHSSGGSGDAAAPAPRWQELRVRRICPLMAAMLHFALAAADGGEGVGEVAATTGERVGAGVSLHSVAFGDGIFITACRGDLFSVLAVTSGEHEAAVRLKAFELHVYLQMAMKSELAAAAAAMASENQDVLNGYTMSSMLDGAAGDEDASRLEARAEAAALSILAGRLRASYEELLRLALGALSDEVREKLQLFLVDDRGDTVSRWPEPSEKCGCDELSLVATALRTRSSVGGERQKCGLPTFWQWCQGPRSEVCIVGGALGPVRVVGLFLVSCPLITLEAGGGRGAHAAEVVEIGIEEASSLKAGLSESATALLEVLAALAAAMGLPFAWPDAAAGIPMQRFADCLPWPPSIGQLPAAASPASPQMLS
eukprot:TRINITY_DN17704_c0_g1_i1.p1 TRINITY_DN17704_c0_g1~~TRINITY_DN17704_c0_g1_i1.p1  ORF type:complete len:488 (+),score=133.26 TRINITY_DN17704_c0_g1_i1:97-1560(+)